MASANGKCQFVVGTIPTRLKKYHTDSKISDSLMISKKGRKYIVCAKSCLNYIIMPFIFVLYTFNLFPRGKNILKSQQVNSVNSISKILCDTLSS